MIRFLNTIYIITIIFHVLNSKVCCVHCKRKSRHSNEPCVLWRYSVYNVPEPLQGDIILLRVDRGVWQWCKQLFYIHVLSRSLVI